ncbi:MAG: LTA synthase family protein [bacterium]|nr:LTA synthase family protein [bacterium]
MITLYELCKQKLEKHLIQTKRDPFWLTTKKYWDKILVVSALPFVALFFRSEWLSITYILITFLAIFIFINKIFSKHPNNPYWTKIHQTFFLFMYSILIANTAIQYFIHRYNILDSAKSYNLIIGRAFSISAFWLIIFGLTDWWHLKKNNRSSQTAKLLIFILFISAIILLATNIGVVYFSGLNINPSIIGQIKGAGELAISKENLIILIASLIAILIFSYIQIRTNKMKKEVPTKTWHYYNFFILVFAFLALLFSYQTFITTPEANIIRSFYRYYISSSETTTLSPIIIEKLKRFGLNYDINQPAIAHQNTAFTATSTNYLPTKFKTTPPNVVIVFLESFSARLSSVYNPLRPNTTPGLEKMASHKNTTVVKNYYNASTPTITGLLAQLCSFLPPTGHQEIEKEKKLKNHRLLCLPKILRAVGGYKYSAYITAVEKDFANKDTIFASMGADEVMGTEELAQYIPGEPLSWGYSDHQTFNFLWDWMQTSTQPFMLMHSTVDTHPPFTKAKDKTPYGNGKSDVLNMVHTTDDAFLQFWNKFITSEFAKNTIIITVADHAIFPAALGPGHFPEVPSTQNFYDRTAFLIYYPDSLLPRKIENYSASIDLAPTVLQMLNINTPNSFEGHSIFSDRASYPNLLGMHELGLYINEAGPNNTRLEKYNTPGNLLCTEKDYTTDSKTPLTLCEFLSYYRWKRYMFEQGRFWEQPLLK